MKRLALAAAGAAVMGLTACTHSAAPPAGGTTGHHTGARAGHAVVPVSCTQQYRSWSQGEGKGVMRTLDGVATRRPARHPKEREAAQRQTERALRRAAAHPIPACADPRGYWAVLLMHLNAVASAHGSAASARAALQGVPKIHHQLVVEVTQAVQ